MGEIYELTDFNPKGSNIKKTQIILTETKRSYKNYINSLKYRYNKKNPFLPNYVISKTGEIYNILKPNEYSEFIDPMRSLAATLSPLNLFRMIASALYFFAHSAT